MSSSKLQSKLMNSIIEDVIEANSESESLSAATSIKEILDELEGNPKVTKNPRSQRPGEQRRFIPDSSSSHTAPKETPKPKNLEQVPSVKAPISSPRIYIPAAVSLTPQSTKAQNSGSIKSVDSPLLNRPSTKHQLKMAKLNFSPVNSDPVQHMPEQSPSSKMRVQKYIAVSPKSLQFPIQEQFQQILYKQNTQQQCLSPNYFSSNGPYIGFNVFPPQNFQEAVRRQEYQNLLSANEYKRVHLPNLSPKNAPVNLYSDYVGSPGFSRSPKTTVSKLLKKDFSQGIYSYGFEPRKQEEFEKQQQRVFVRSPKSLPYECQPAIVNNEAGYNSGMRHLFKKSFSAENYY